MVPLVILALLAALVGGVSLSNATAGVGIIATGCLFAILARIAQASSHHAAVMKAIGVTTKAPIASTVMCPKCAEVSPRGQAVCPHCGSAFQ